MATSLTLPTNVAAASRPAPATAPTAVSVVGLSKEYRLYRQPIDRLKELLFPRKQRSERVWAVRDVSFDIPQGQVLGLIGTNGSGKSTLLRMVTGVLQPTTGAVATNGRVTALLELGAGFNPDFTGRENAFLNGALLGLNPDEVRARLPAMLDFAGIGPFIDHPVKTYSSGMYVRLAFSIAVNIDPDILIVDEALAVGDTFFQHRCMRRMHEFRAAGKTILFVTHDTAAVKALCDRAILLHEGRMIDDGAPDAVVGHYLQRFYFNDVPLDSPAPLAPARDGADALPVAGALADQEIERQLPNIDARYGTGAARVVGLACYDSQGRRTDDLTIGDPLIVRISVQCHQRVERPNIGFVLKDRLGSDLAGSNTTLEGVPLAPAPAGAFRTATFRMALPRLHPGHYSISPTIADGDLTTYTMCDWVENARVVQFAGRYHTGCIMHPPVTVEVAGMDGAGAADATGLEARGSAPSSPVR